MTNPVPVKSFVMLYPDGSNRSGKFMKTDETVVMTEKAERNAAARILGCKKVYCLEVKLQREGGIYLANVYFDPEAGDKHLPVNNYIEMMIHEMHDQNKAPYPELPVQLFGPVMLVPVDAPKPSSVVLH